MQSKVLVVPGIYNSGPEHWQSRWEVANPSWSRLQVPDWNEVERADWVQALEQQVSALGEDTVIVAHSLGCLAVAHWAAEHGRRIRAAMLVAVPDPQGPAFPAAAHGFAPLPMARLPFPSLVVASEDDRYGSIAHAQRCADAWGSRWQSVGAAGHLNEASGLGDWPPGRQWLAEMMQETATA